MKTITIQITKTPRTFELAGRRIEVDELGIELVFARKPYDIGRIAGDGFATRRVYITREVRLSPEAFDEFAANFFEHRPWLDGEGGTVAGGYLCVEVSAPGRPYLYVNPEGHGYARYVARLG